jgi:menaquinone-dependent protoporphyrinogen IX oxidase
MYSPTFTDLLKAEGVEEMARQGYWIHYSTIIPNEHTQAVEDSVGRAELYRHTLGHHHTQLDSATVKYFDSAKRTPEVRELWRKFLENGINVPTISSCLQPSRELIWNSYRYFFCLSLRLAMKTNSGDKDR